MNITDCTSNNLKLATEVSRILGVGASSVTNHFIGWPLEDADFLLRLGENKLSYRAPRYQPQPLRDQIDLISVYAERLGVEMEFMGVRKDPMGNKA